MKKTSIARWTTICLLLWFAIACSTNRSANSSVETAQNSQNQVPTPTSTPEAERIPSGPSEPSPQTASYDTTYDPKTVQGYGDGSDQSSFIAQIRYSNVPLWVRESFFKQKLNERYVMVFRDIRPLYLRGDFNGDSKIDIALMLQEKPVQNGLSSPLIMAIFQGGTEQATIIDDPDKLGADDIWAVVPQEEMAKYPSISALGEGILMAKAASASRTIYWDGKEYNSLQTSD
ncbi:hypothetical protein NDA01_22020 [Trichocoleus desertorum AS-A10]|uniref:hypothetical protein n=1 Tax=Trichocoleus desertorum TaxID=1481672 RepID=UPI0032975E8A